MNNFIVSVWYGKNRLLAWLLLPFALVFRLLVLLRRFLYQKNFLRVYKSKVPVIVVGNISVGGTGKTPLIIWLANYLLAQGFKPGIVSRGYGGKYQGASLVMNNSDAAVVGDEPLLIRKRTKVPFAVAKNRVLAVEKILETHACDIILSDDGLQHYALGRDIEIAVIDGNRHFGNGFCLPAGPLREPVSRLKKVDFLVINGNSALEYNMRFSTVIPVKAGISLGHEYVMQLEADKFYNVAAPHISKELDDFSGKKVHALAGIGNPTRFFTLLRKLDLDIIEHVFPDHYPFTAKDIDFADDLMVVMTEKDAIKCSVFASEKHWFLSVNAKLEDRFAKDLAGAITKLEK